MKFSFVKASQVLDQRPSVGANDSAARAAFHIFILGDEKSPYALVEKALLKRLDCRVSVVRSKSDLLSLAPLDSPDLLLLNLYVKDDSNLKVCEGFKRLEGMEDVPVIFFLDEWNALLRAAALRAGAVDYIKTPFYPTELIAKVQFHKQLKDSRDALLRTIREQEDLLRLVRPDL